MPIVQTNAPPVDPNLLNRNIVRGPRLVDVGPPEPVPAPTLVDVGAPAPVVVPRLADVGKPKPPSIQELADHIDTDLNFYPSDEQLDEYFAWKDEQPFGMKKTWDATVNAVGMALTDITKAVAAGVSDPKFYGPVSATRTATIAEAAARGTWDLSILGKMMIDKVDELHSGYYDNFPESPTSDEWSKESKFRNPRKFLVKKHNEAYPDKKIDWRDIYHDGYTEIEPGDYDLFKRQWNEEMSGNRRDKWRTMRWIINTRQQAREGKKTILGEFLGEEADKQILPYINQKVAEGGSYFLDPSLPVGLASTPIKATAKPLLSRVPGLTKVAPWTERGFVGPGVEVTGKGVKWTGQQAEKIGVNISKRIEQLQKWLGEGEVIEVGLSPRPVTRLQALPKPLTIAGESLEALGRSMGVPETLESTLQRAGRIAESGQARAVLKKAAYLDPAITLVDNLVTGTIEGGKAGGILALPSGEEEFIGGAIGTGMAMGGGGGVVGGIGGKKFRTQEQARNTVNEWINAKTPEERKAIQDLKLTPVEAASVATAELLGRGIIGEGQISDINFVYLSQPEYISKIHPELLVDGKLPKVLPPGTRGAQAEADGTPTVYINTGHTGPRSIFHEMWHAMSKFDELGDQRIELRSLLFDQKAPDGTVLKRGLYSDEDIDIWARKYREDLPEKSRADWEKQFEVLRDQRPDEIIPGEEPKKVRDVGATRENMRQYIMEEVESESFANFVKESGPEYLREARTLRQTVLDRWLLQDHLKTTRVLRAVLGKWGVPFGADGNPTGLFWKGGKPISNSPELNRIMREAVRSKDSSIRMLMDESGEQPALTIGSSRGNEGRKKVEAALKSADGKLLVKHFENNDIFKRDPETGDILFEALTETPILLERKQIEALQANRAAEIQAALEAIGIESGGMMPKLHKDGSISWEGIPTDAQLAAILKIANDIIPPGMKDTITDVAWKMRTPGQPILLDYNPRLNKRGRYDSNLSSGLRVAVPLGFHVSKAKNFYFTSLDMGALRRKLADWGDPGSKNHKNLKMWDGDVRRFEQDVYRYLENHKADRPGESGLDSDGVTAVAKKDIINDVFNVAEKDANPITEARKATKRTGKARHLENPIRTRRFDGINRIEKNRVTKYGVGRPIPMKTQADAYRKWKQNLMPGGEVRYMPGEPFHPGRDPRGFYSRVLEVAIGDKIPNRATGDQMLATIAKQPGVKKEEIAWLGLEEFLRGKDRVTKEELGDFIRENDVRLEETVFGEFNDTQSKLDEINRQVVAPNSLVAAIPDSLFDTAVRIKNDKAFAEKYFAENADLINERKRLMDELKTLTPDTQYQKYQLPGAEPGSYREMVLRLPRKKENTRELLGEPEKVSVEDSENYEFGYEDLSHVLRYKDGGEIGVQKDGKYALAIERDYYVSDDLPALEMRLAEWFQDEGGSPFSVQPKNYRSSHWNEPNVLAHVRFNDRTGPNGEKILFVEEVQSDWHREGRERGYAGEAGKPKAAILKSNSGESYALYSPDKERIGWFSTREEAAEKATSLGFEPVNEVTPTQLEKVPDAPFKTSWHELVMKRMLRHAAENGYEKLAWISGDETAKRYDLSKQVGKLVVSKSDETGKIALDADGELVGSSIDPQKLESYVGKEVAKRALDLLENESPDMGGNKSVELTGDDLKVGGQWASNLYDRMIPQFMKKYGKKWGAKVEDAAIDLGGYKVNKDNNALPYRLEETDSPAIISRHATAEDAWRAAQELSSSSFKAIDITPAMTGDVMGGQVKFAPATPGPRTTTQITPTSQPVNLVMDKIYRLPEKEKEERKDRAMEILKQFSKP